MNWFRKRRAAGASQKLSRQLLRQYETKKLRLVTVLEQAAAKEVGSRGRRSGRIGALAANLMTSEPPPPHLMAAISESDRELASTLVQQALKYDDVVAVAAKAAWWLAMASFQMDFDLGTKTLKPDSADRILTLARRATELAPEESEARAVELDQYNPEALRILAISAICLARYDEAESLIYRARQIHPSLQGYDEALVIIRDAREGRCDPEQASARARRL